MTLGYLNAAIARGARLYSPVDICDIDAREDGVTLHSARGPEIRARQVGMATGHGMMKGIPRKGNRSISSWSVETRTQPRSIWPTEIGRASRREGACTYVKISRAPQTIKKK